MHEEKVIKDYRKHAVEMTKSHWEKDVSASVFPRTKKHDQLDNWIAKAGTEWPQPHVKVDECDH